MKIFHIQARQAHYIPDQAYRVGGGSIFRDTASVGAGSKGGIPNHLLGESLRQSQEITYPDQPEEITGTAQNGFTPVIMVRCSECNLILPNTRIEDHICV